MTSIPLIYVLRGNNINLKIRMSSFNRSLMINQVQCSELKLCKHNYIISMTRERAGNDVKSFKFFLKHMEKFYEKIITKGMQKKKSNYLKTFAQIESNYKLRLGLSSFIKNIL